MTAQVNELFTANVVRISMCAFFYLTRHAFNVMPVGKVFDRRRISTIRPPYLHQGLRILSHNGMLYSNLEY